MSRFLAIASKYPVAVLTVVFLLTAIALCGIVDPKTGAVRLEIDPSADRLLTEDHDAREVYDRIRNLFGSDEPLVLALAGAELFRAENLERIVRLTEQLEALPEVHHVLSLATATNIKAEDDLIEIAPFLDEIPRSPAELADLRATVLANPIYGGSLLSKDGQSTALLVYFNRLSDKELIRSGIDRRIRALADQERGDLELWMSGAPHVKSRTSEALQRNFARIVPGIACIIGLMLVAAFRSFRGALLPLSTIAISLAWTLGAMGWFGHSLNLVTTIVPPLIVTLGFAYSMHVVSEYYDAARHAGPGADRRELVAQSIRDVGLPIAITGITTIAGFLSLTVNPLAAIREFGRFAVLGITFTAIVSLTFTPAMLALLPSPKRGVGAHRETPLQRFANRLSDFDFKNRGIIIGVSVAILILMAAATTEVRVSTGYINGWKESSDVRRDYNEINERLGGVNTFYVAFESPVAEAFAEPANLRELRDFQHWLRAQPEIGGATSIVDYAMLINQSLHAGNPDHFAIPATKRLAMQLYLFGASDDLDRLVDSRYQKTNLLVRTRIQDSERLATLITRIEERLKGLPPHIDSNVTGSIVLLNRTVDDIARGQVQSIAIAIGIIYLVLSAMFTSFRIGLVALFPNVLPIAIYFGALGLSGVTLNPATSLIACMALGVAVDDTIHYFARFNRDAKRAAREMPATRSALRVVIRPVTYTTAGLCLGFLVLTTSELRSHAEFGMLAALTLGAAWLIDVTLTPALCASVRIVTLWDVLRLDLGRDPHSTIELFQDLGPRQARVVALMGSLKRYPGGEKLFSEGDDAHDIAVVIDGEVGISFVRDGSRVQMSKIARGKVVGPSAMASGRRTADADALTDIRLLHITAEDMVRLRHRYPRIAAQVYRNLNRVQGQRIATLMDRIGDRWRDPFEFLPIDPSDGDSNRG